MAILRALVIMAGLLTADLFVQHMASGASTFTSSTIMEIGPDGRQVTIRTLQGESFSLDVVSPDIVKGMRKGDQVSLELDAQDRVHKMVKLGEEAERPKPRTSGEQEY
jgi:hypothetical protein